MNMENYIAPRVRAPAALPLSKAFPIRSKEESGWDSKSVRSRGFRRIYLMRLCSDYITPNGTLLSEWSRGKDGVVAYIKVLPQHIWTSIACKIMQINGHAHYCLREKKESVSYSCVIVGVASSSDYTVANDRVIDCLLSLE
jgi:hypothetical protein